VTKETNPPYFAKFKLEVAKLVVDGEYKIKVAADLMSVSKLVMDKWGR
jgi:hypothetical protein